MGNLHSALVADGERLRDAEIRARHKRELDILVLGMLARACWLARTS